MQKNRLIALTATLTMSAALALAAGADQTPQTTESSTPAASAAAPAAAAATTAPAPTVAPAAPAAKPATRKAAGGRVGHGGFGRFATLNLTEAQTKQVDGIEKTFRADNKALFASLAELRARTREARSKNDQAALDALEATKKSKRTEMATALEARDKRIAAVLTPEQLKQWQAFKNARPKARKQHASRPAGQ